MKLDNSGPRKETTNGIRFLVGAVIGNDSWRVDWRCLQCGAHDFATGGDARQKAEAAAQDQMIDHAAKCPKGQKRKSQIVDITNHPTLNFQNCLGPQRNVRSTDR